MTEFRSSLGERIKEARTKKNMSLEALGDKIKMTKSALSKVERGIVSISSENLFAISQALDTSVEWLMTGKENTLDRLRKNGVEVKKINLSNLDSSRHAIITAPTGQGKSASFRNFPNTTRFEQTPEYISRESVLFFDEKRETTSHFRGLIDSLDEKDREFINRYIELAMFQREHSTKEASSINRVDFTPQVRSTYNQQTMVNEEPGEYETSSSAIPILGRAAAGVPIEMVRFIEGYLKVPQKFKNCFAVMVQGESMVDAGIIDGGYVVVRQQPHVENNDIALVMVDDRVTIKRFKLENDLAYLISENDGMEDQVYDPKEKNMQILGLVVDIITPKEAQDRVIEELS